MPVVPYAEPTIAPNIAQPWPQRAEMQLNTLAARCDLFHGRLVVIERWIDDNDRLFDELSVMHGSLFEHKTTANHDERFYTQDERINALVSRVKSLENALFAVMKFVEFEADDADF